MACGIRAEEKVLVIEASFHLFVNSLGGDGVSDHRFDNRRAARAVLGREDANELIVKTQFLILVIQNRLSGIYSIVPVGESPEI